MKYFSCSNCDLQIFFMNSKCTHCHTELGYVAENKEMVSFEKQTDEVWKSLNPNLKNKLYKPCFNYSHHHVCNWMIPADSDEIYCESCKLTSIIPNLDNPDHIIYWARLEHAKRRFLYMMQQLNIMPRPKKDANDQFGLQFNFLMPEPGQPVLTGHAHGLITLNASEADVVYRETTRVKMGENYRTLLGHFRHESGHFYFDLIQQIRPDLIDEFRNLFGDERQDYSEALQTHYHSGPPKNWQDNFISSYASAHPWEDWAETWAHYLHMMDTLETAFYAGLCVNSKRSDLPSMIIEESPIGAENFETVLQNWMTITFNLNALNRSMGLDDAYPFTLSDKVLDKLRFIHDKLLELSFQK